MRMCPKCLIRGVVTDGGFCEFCCDFTSDSIVPADLPSSIEANRENTLPADPKERKTYPVASGFMDYFPDAILAIAHISWIGNQQHHPNEPLHWDRSKSTDEADAMLRHFLRRGTLDSDGTRHSAKMAWRALAILQKELEAERK